MRLKASPDGVADAVIEAGLSAQKWAFAFLGLPFFIPQGEFARRIQNENLL
jgi:hypothetical protein